MRFLFFFSFCLSFLYSSESFLILSFDGGGIRGVIPLTFVSEIKKETEIDLAKKADLIAGTSTGSLIATALNLGIDVDELLEKYKELSSQIFLPVPTRFVDHLIQVDSKYSTINLKNALQSVFQTLRISDPKLGDFSKYIVIPTVHLYSPIQKRWHLDVRENFTQEGKALSIMDVILQSTAAPTYFPSYQNCVDGGMGANNPALIALIQTLKHKKTVPLQDIRLVSFGTGYLTDSIEHGESWGVYSWLYQFHPSGNATSTPLISLLFDVQDELASQICKNLLHRRFMRIDMPLNQTIDLDDVTKIDMLIALVKEYIKQNPIAFQKICDWVRTEFH